MDLNKTERRKGFLINILFFAVVAAILYVIVVKAFPLFMPFIIAFLIAAILNKPAFRIHKKFPKIKKSTAGRILFLIVIIVLLVIIAFAGVSIANYIKNFATWRQFKAYSRVFARY